MELFSGVVLMLFYLFAFFMRKSKNFKLGVKPSLVLKKVHYIALVVCAVAIVLYNAFDLVLSGVWTVPVVSITVFLTGIFYHLLSAKLYASKMDRIYFATFSRLPFFLVLVLMIPFLGIVVVASIFFRLMIPETTFYQDDRIIISSDFKGVLDYRRFRVLKREGLLNKAVEVENSGYNADSIAVQYDKNEANIYFYNFADGGKQEVSDSLKVNIK